MKTVTLEHAMRTKRGLQMLIIRHAAGRCSAEALKHLVSALLHYEHAEDWLGAEKTPSGYLDMALNALHKARESACFSGACEENSDDLRTINGICSTLCTYLYG